MKEPRKKNRQNDYILTPYYYCIRIFNCVRVYDNLITNVKQGIYLFFISVVGCDGGRGNFNSSGIPCCQAF